MAIYHLSAKTVSRGSSQGQSAGAKVRYIARCGGYEKQGDTVRLVESEHMPAWVDSPAALEYWAAADEYERANGRLCKELEFALPRELAAEQQLALARRFAKAVAATPEGSLPYTLAIHEGRGHNPHCHLLLSERIRNRYDRKPESYFKRYNADKPYRGGARKSTALHPKEWLTENRERWAAFANQALAEHGHEGRIDHRSLAAQGIQRAPQQHLGPRTHAALQKGIETTRVLRQRAARLVDLGVAEWRQLYQEMRHGVERFRAQFQQQQLALLQPRRERGQEQDLQPRRERGQEQDFDLEI